MALMISLGESDDITMGGYIFFIACKTARLLYISDLCLLGHSGILFGAFLSHTPPPNTPTAPPPHPTKYPS